MKNLKLLETLADIAYIAGYHQYYSGDSRMDMSGIIAWAHEFEAIHQNTDWDEENYMLTVEAFTKGKLKKESDLIFVFEGF